MIRWIRPHLEKQVGTLAIRLGITAAASAIIIIVFVWLSRFVDFAMTPFDSGNQPVSVLVLVAAGLIVAVATLDWRRTLWLLMLWLVIGDLIRRMLPGQPPQLMLVTDIITAGIYIGYLVERVMSRSDQGVPWPTGFLIALFIFATVSILGMFNPSLPNLWFGFVGLHSYAWFLPLIFVGGELSRDSRSSLNLMAVVSALCIPLFLLAVYQYFNFSTLPPALQSFHGDLDYHSFGNDLVPLVSSALGNAEKYSRYATLGLFLSLAMIADFQLSVRRRVLAMMSACAALGGVFVSGRRTPLYLCVIGTTFVLWKMRYVFKSATLWISLLLLFFAGVYAHVLRSQKIENRSEYFMSSIPLVQQRLDLLLSEIDIVSSRAGIFGRGTGSDSQGLDYVPGGVPLTGNTPIENGVTKVWWELGPLGVASFLSFWFLGGALLFTKASRAQKSRAYSYLLSYATYFCLIFIWFSKGHQIMGDVATGIDQWLFFGIIAALAPVSSIKTVEQRSGPIPVAKCAPLFSQASSPLAARVEIRRSDERPRRTTTLTPRLQQPK